MVLETTRTRLAAPSGALLVTRRLATVLLAMIATVACAPAEADRSPWTVEELAGKYWGPPLFPLELRADGTYQAFVTNGSSDGCLTVVGAGPSRGTWTLEGGTISLAPTFEPFDLARGLAGVTVRPSEEGLRVILDGIDYLLERQDVGSGSHEE